MIYFCTVDKYELYSWGQNWILAPTINNLFFPNKDVGRIKIFDANHNFCIRW
jgi:hypothetical protein